MVKMYRMVGKINSSDIKDKWGVTLKQRLNNLHRRSVHLGFEEYKKQERSIIMSYNKCL